MPSSSPVAPPPLFPAPTIFDAPPKAVRATWDEYFLRIATEVSTRATCPRKHVGALLVRERSILASGYNGSVRGMPHCEDVGCMMVDGHCARTIHAEVNALAQAAKNGVRVDGATVYVTAMPCWACAKVLLNAGITRIVYADAYRPDPLVLAATLALGIELVELVVPIESAGQVRTVDGERT